MKTVFTKFFSFLCLLFLTSQAFSQIVTKINQRGSSTTARSGAGTITISKPTGVVSGDLLLANIVQNDATNNNLSNVVIPTGWFLVDGQSIYDVIGSGGGSDKEWWGTILYKIADGTESSSFNFTLDTDAEMAIGSIIAFSGVDVTGGFKPDGTVGGPFDVDPGTLNLTNTATASATAISNITSNAAIVMLSQVANDRKYSNWTAITPSSLTELYDDTTQVQDDASVGAAWTIKSSIGSTGSASVTLTGSDRNAAMLIALKPISYSSAATAGVIITQRGSSTTASSTTTTLTITKPTGVVAGDVLFLNLVQNETDNDNGFSTNTPNPALTGWTLVDGKQIESAGTANGDNLWWGSLYYKVADGAEGTSLSFSLNSRTDMAIGTIVAFSGVDVTGGVKADGTASGPFDVDPSTFTVTTAASTSVSASSLTTVSANTALIMFGQASNDLRAFSLWTTATAGNLTELYDNETSSGDQATVAAAWMIKGVIGSVGAGSATIANNDFNAGILVALKPIPPVSPYKYYNGSYGAIQNNSSTTNVSVVSKTIPLSASYFNSSSVKKVSIVFESSKTISNIYADKNGNGFFDISSTTDFALVQNTDFVIETVSTGVYKITINLPVITVGGSLFNLFIQSTANSNLFMDQLSLAATALPVTLTSFTAKPTSANTVALNWATSSEIVNKGFRIERNDGGVNGKFESLGFVASKSNAGNSQTALYYNFIDASPISGATAFYRLAQEDLDGRTTFSEIRVVKLNGETVYMVFPNPSNGAVNISRTGIGNKMNIQVIDMAGRMVLQFTNITDSNYKLNIRKSGIYNIKMTYPETGEESVQKIVIEN